MRDKVGLGSVSRAAFVVLVGGNSLLGCVSLHQVFPGHPLKVNWEMTAEILKDPAVFLQLQTVLHGLSIGLKKVGKA